MGACSRPPGTVEVLQTVASQQAGLVASLYKFDTGGGVFGTIYYVVRIRRESDPADLSPATKYDKFIGQSPDLPHPARILIRWRNPAQLDVFYYSVDINQFKSRWYNASASPRFVELVLTRIETDAQWAVLNTSD